MKYKASARQATGRKDIEIMRSKQQWEKVDHIYWLLTYSTLNVGAGVRGALQDLRLGLSVLLWGGLPRQAAGFSYQTRPQAVITLSAHTTLTSSRPPYTQRGEREAKDQSKLTLCLKGVMFG